MPARRWSRPSRRSGPPPTPGRSSRRRGGGRGAVWRRPCGSGTGRTSRGTPDRHPSWIPGFPQNENRFDLVRVFTDDGVVGVSAGPAMARERDGIGTVLGPYLLGEDPTDIDAMQQRLREIGYLGLRNWWIEPAFWDIKGKLADKPVYELLGGERRPVPVYASTGQVRRSPKRRPISLPHW